MGCIVCQLQGLGKTPPQIHHILTGVGMGQRATHQETIPLCYHHHQGVEGVHTWGVRAWEERIGYTELELLGMVGELI